MNWESLIMPVIAGSIALVGAIGGYFTYKARIDELNKRADANTGIISANSTRLDTLEAASQQRVMSLGEKLVALELRVERECVKKDDLERVEDRIGKRLDGVEHAVKNTATQIISALTRQPRARGGSE